MHLLIKAVSDVLVCDLMHHISKLCKL